MSDQEYASFDEILQVDLYEQLNREEQARQGGVKSYVADSEKGLIYESSNSDCFVTAERVLAVDVVHGRTPGWQVRSVRATLTLKNAKSGPAVNPIVEAWAPFHKLLLTEPQRATYKQTDKKSINLGANFSGADGHVEWSRKNEISFERIHYNQAYTTPIMDHDTKQRAGVEWFMERSDFQTKSVMPEFYAAVLFTRETDDAYLVGFDIEIRGGTIFDFQRKLKKTLGIKPGHTKPFLIRPANSPVTRGEGEEFLRGIDSRNLGNLRAKDDITALTITRALNDEEAKGEASAIQQYMGGGGLVMATVPQGDWTGADGTEEDNL